jgi:hypothetical protein
MDLIHMQQVVCRASGKSSIFDIFTDYACALFLPAAKEVAALVRIVCVIVWSFLVLWHVLSPSYRSWKIAGAAQKDFAGILRLSRFSEPDYGESLLLQETEPSMRASYAPDPDSGG